MYTFFKEVSEEEKQRIVKEIIAIIYEYNIEEFNQLKKGKYENITISIAEEFNDERRTSGGYTRELQRLKKIEDKKQKEEEDYQNREKIYQEQVKYNNEQIQKEFIQKEIEEYKDSFDFLILEALKLNKRYFEIKQEFNTLYTENKLKYSDIFNEEFLILG